METNRRLALLIDGDNAQAALLPQMLAAVSKYGTVTIRRVYGDWSKPHMATWKEVVNTHALQAEHQFNYTPGKNATDFRLIIDAMDILYTNEVDGFCIVSSDSDYTPLVARIRKNNLFAIGIGKALTPQTFRNACNLFIVTENLPVPVDEAPKTTSRPAVAPQKVSDAEIKNTLMPTDLKKLIRKAIKDAKEADGWASFSAVGQSLHLDTEFNARTDGPKKIAKIVSVYPSDFDTEERKSKKGNPVTYIRLKVTSKSTKKAPS